MDKRLELTDAQMRMVFRFNDLCKEMRNAGILFVEHEGNIRVINGLEAKDHLFPEDIADAIECGDDIAEVRFDKMEATEMVLSYYGAYADETMGFKFNEDEEI